MMPGYRADFTAAELVAWQRANRQAAERRYWASGFPVIDGDGRRNPNAPKVAPGEENNNKGERKL